MSAIYDTGAVAAAIVATLFVAYLLKDIYLR